MRPRQRQLLLLGCAILAIVGAFLGYRLVRPELGPARVEHDALNGPAEGRAGEGPPRLTGAPGDGARAPGATPPPPMPPTSTETTDPSVGRFRATGIVRSGQDGPGIPHATVEVADLDDATSLRTGETDGAGRFSIDLPGLDGLSPEARSLISITARAYAKGHRAGAFEDMARGDFSGPPRDAEATLVLLPGHNVSGRVVDEEGLPLARVRVTLYGSNRMISEYTDLLGRWRFPIVAADSVFFLAHRVGIGTASIPATPLSPDADTELADLVMRKGAEVAGTLVNAAGRPIAGVPVYATCLSVPPRGGAREEIGAPSGTEYGSAMTDGQGRFRITGLFPGRVRLKPVTTEDGSDASAADAVETGRTDVRLVVSGHVLRVTVVDSTDTPLLGSTCLVTETDVSPPRSQRTRPHPDAGGSHAQCALVAEGANVLVAASHPGCMDAELKTKCEGAGPSQVTLRLMRRGAPGRVRLTLTGESASRVRHLSVNVSSPGTGEHEGDTIDRVVPIGEVLELASGKRRIELLPLEGDEPYDGTYFLPVDVDVEVPPGGNLDAPVPVRLGGRLLVKLVWPEGTTQAVLMSTRLRSLDGVVAPAGLPWIQVAGGQTNWGASLLLHTSQPISTAVGLEPGRWILELDVSEYATAQVAATVKAGETTSVTAVLERKAK